VELFVVDDHLLVGLGVVIENLEQINPLFARVGVEVGEVDAELVHQTGVGRFVCCMLRQDWVGGFNDHQFVVVHHILVFVAAEQTSTRTGHHQFVFPKCIQDTLEFELANRRNVVSPGGVSCNQVRVVRSQFY